MFGKSMVDCLVKASNIKKDYGDQYVSIEHLVLALGTHSLTLLLTHSLTHLLTHLLSYSLTHLLTHSLVSRN